MVVTPSLHALRKARTTRLLRGVALWNAYMNADPDDADKDRAANLRWREWSNRFVRDHPGVSEHYVYSHISALYQAAYSAASDIASQMEGDQ